MSTRTTGSEIALACTAEPAVSIIVLCRNERKHIERCVRSILAQEPPPGGFEVIVADGMSSDGTRDILERLSADEPRLRVVDNPSLITPCAMNIGISQARGRYIAIMGGHTHYGPDYVRRCVELLEEHPEVCCSGGPIVSQGRGAFGRAVAAAMSHPAGIGNAKHRFPDYEGYAEGACFPMFRREVFDLIGLYDEQLVRNQDDDFNYRVAQSGGKVFISPRANCIYFVRESPLALFRQYFQYGFWRVAVLKKHRLPASIRQLVPVSFYALLLVLLFVGLSLDGWWRLLAVVLPAAYLLLQIGAAIDVSLKRGLLVGCIFPVASGIMQFAYAVGFASGFLMRRRSQSDAAPILQRTS
jgi:succinoglycan biosynthesis protein ExoA